MNVWSLGEVLWDIFPDQERFGGAPLNFCVNLHRMGDRATLLSAVGNDARGHLALAKMHELGLATERVLVDHELPTGTATIFTTADGEHSYTIPRPVAFDHISLDPSLLTEATTAGIDWLYFGTLLQTDDAIEQFTARLARHLPDTRVFYDMNLRIGQWNLSLVQRLSRLANILKLNEAEAETLFQLTKTSASPFSLEAFCNSWAKAYDIDAICITLGPAGCLLYNKGHIVRVPGYAVTVCDTVGSGDAFAAAFLHGYHLKWPILQTAKFANALGAVVASRAGATPDWSLDEVAAIAGLDSNNTSTTSQQHPRPV